MAVTTQARDESAVIADPDKSQFEGEKRPLLRVCSTTDCEDSDDGYGSESSSITKSCSVSSLSSSGSSGTLAVAAPKCEVKEEANFDHRAMTPMQERFNAITMLPGMIYSIHFCWLVASSNQQSGGAKSWLPPLSVIASAVATLVHSSCSMLYHWKYATTIIEPSKRIEHWSRRLDSASIHFASAFASYSTTGRVDYFILNVLFNLDSSLKHAEEEVQPRRNLNRIGISILLYILPVLVYGHYDLFAQYLIMFALCGWLFVRYPFGGWSHGMFHLVLTFLPYLVLTGAMKLEASQLRIALAAVTCDGNLCTSFDG